MMVKPAEHVLDVASMSAPLAPHIDSLHTLMADGTWVCWFVTIFTCPTRAHQPFPTPRTISVDDSGFLNECFRQKMMWWTANNKPG